jgi:hypothetical protein
VTYPDGPLGQDGYHVGVRAEPVITVAMIDVALNVLKDCMDNDLPTRLCVERALRAALLVGV